MLPIQLLFKNNETQKQKEKKKRKKKKEKTPPKHTWSIVNYHIDHW